MGAWEKLRDEARRTAVVALERGIGGGACPGAWWAASSDGRRLRVLQTALHVLRPVADVLVRVEHQVHRAGHVVLALTLAHVVHRAVALVRVVGDVVVLLLASHLVR